MEDPDNDKRVLIILLRHVSVFFLPKPDYNKGKSVSGNMQTFTAREQCRKVFFLKMNAWISIEKSKGTVGKSYPYIPHVLFELRLTKLDGRSNAIKYVTIFRCKHIRHGCAHVTAKTHGSASANAGRNHPRIRADDFFQPVFTVHGRWTEMNGEGSPARRRVLV